MKYEQTRCNENSGLANIFFYYDKSLHCDMRLGASDPLPAFKADVPCNHLCDDGSFTSVTPAEKLKNTPLSCEKCPPN